MVKGKGKGGKSKGKKHGKHQNDTDTESETEVRGEQDKLALLEKIVFNLRDFNPNSYNGSLRRLQMGVSEKDPKNKSDFLQKIRIIKTGSDAGICVIVVEFDDPYNLNTSKSNGVCRMEFVLRDGDMYLDAFRVNGGPLIHFFKEDAEITLNLPGNYQEMNTKAGADLKKCTGSHMNLLNSCHLFYKLVMTRPNTTDGLKGFPLKEYACAYLEMCVALCETTRLRTVFAHVWAHYPNGSYLLADLIEDIHKWENLSEEFDVMKKTRPTKAMAERIANKLIVAKVIDKKNKKKK